MKLNVDRALIRRILLWCVLLAVAPFAIEVLLLADVVGIEAALAFLFLYAKSTAILARDRLVYAYNVLSAAIASAPGSDDYNHKVYSFGVAFSFTLFWVTGSLAVSLVAWTPSAIALAQQLGV